MAELERFREVQRLAYRCVETIAAELEPGVTEREAVRRMRRWLIGAGVDDWFHLPFAWFGDRTAFAGFRQPLQFFPTDRRLEAGMPFILDVAPIVRGVSADVGYSGVLGENSVLSALQQHLLEHRRLIVELVKERCTLAEIYRRVDRLAKQQGLTNRHRVYPFGVLAHHVKPLEAKKSRGTIAGFGLRTIGSLARSMAVRGWSPLWSGARRSEHAPIPGLWAVEPHFAIGDVGAKFEELLVVTEKDAYWLDDDLPHVRRFSGAKAA